MKHLVSDLRADFDAAFAVAPAPIIATRDYLRVRSGPHTYLLCLEELSGIYKDPTIVPFPSATTDMLGLANLKGAPVPVYALQTLLGADLASGSSADAQPWLALCAGKHALAIAFDALEEHLRISATESVAALSLPPLIDALAKRCASLDMEL